MSGPSIVWFRDDLRLADNPALRAAIARDEPVIGLYVLDEESPGIRPLGGAARWWLEGSLRSLADRLSEKGGCLILRRGPAARVVPDVAAQSAAAAVFWNRRYGAPERAVDTALKDSLRRDGIDVASFAASLLFEPWTVRDGSPYSVFTPFWRACQSLSAPRAPLPEPRRIPAPDAVPASEDLDEWMLRPTAPDWAGGLRATWEPGEPAARARLQAFTEEDLGDYDRARDEPAAGATSLLSPRLRWGELSPHTVWHAVAGTDAGRQSSPGAGRVGGEPAGRSAGEHAHQSTGGPGGDGPVGDSASAGAGRFLSELGWREFSWHTLFHSPELATRNWRPEFDAFPWPQRDPALLAAWQRGRTGIPLVDAGMRELWHTGWMHNRVRMVVGSFLSKNLLIHWRRGEEWFWDTLVDADAAANAFNWQWVAGSGADAAPYFRVFNPQLQAKKFDPRSEYIRRWAPEYLDGGGTLAPPPLVDLGASRKGALAAYERMRRTAR